MILGMYRNFSRERPHRLRISLPQGIISWYFSIKHLWRQLVEADCNSYFDSSPLEPWLGRVDTCCTYACTRPTETAQNRCFCSKHECDRVPNAQLKSPSAATNYVVFISGSEFGSEMKSRSLSTQSKQVTQHI